MGKRKNTQDSVVDDNDIIPMEVPVKVWQGEPDEMPDPAVMGKRLAFWEHQIAAGATQMAIALKAIKDEKLYLAREYDSMEAYIKDCIPLSLRTVQYYLQIADALNEKTLEKFSGTPMKLLIEISRSEELREEANSDDADADDVVKKAREYEKKRYEKRISEYKEIIDAKETLLQDLRDKSQEVINRKDDEIDKLKNAVQSMAARDGIDPDRLVFVTQKQEAIALIEDILTSTLRQLSDITNIPHDLMDPELTGRLTYAVSAIKSGIGRIEDTFFIELKTANENVNIIPE